MSINELDNAIAAARRELEMRERAWSHLSGIPRQHNENAIHHLYDRLNSLIIERMERS